MCVFYTNYTHTVSPRPPLTFLKVTNFDFVLLVILFHYDLILGFIFYSEVQVWLYLLIHLFTPSYLFKGSVLLVYQISEEDPSRWIVSDTCF